MDKSEYRASRFIENNVGVVLSGLLVAFVCGTLAMIYSSDQANKIFETKLTYISGAMVDLKDHIKRLETQIQAGVKDRWNREDHQRYEQRIELKLNRIEDRVFKLEMKKTNQGD